MSRGRDAEDLAAAFLENRGMRILARNYRCRFGEIDLIAREGQVLVFVEVRHRSSAAYGGAAASITAAKRDRLLCAARHYLAGRSPLPPCRFDAVLVEGEPARIDWMRNVFAD